MVRISEREPANASDNLSVTQDNSRICEPVESVEESASSLRTTRRGSRGNTRASTRGNSRCSTRGSTRGDNRGVNRIVTRGSTRGSNNDGNRVGRELKLKTISNNENCQVIRSAADIELGQFVGDVADIETIENITGQKDLNSDHSSMDITVSTTRKASKFYGLLKYKATPFGLVNVPASTIKRGIPRSNLSKTDIFLQ